MDAINFSSLVSQIQYTHDALQENAHLVINRHVTARNLAITVCQIATR